MALKLIQTQGDGIPGDRLGAALPTITAPLSGVELVGRSKHGIPWSADVRTTPNFAEGSGNAAGRSVEIEDDGAPGGWRHLANVSDRYLLTPNTDLLDLALEIADASGYRYAPSRIFWNGRRFAAVVRLLDITEDVGAADQPDPIGLCVVVRSSYDTSWKMECQLIALRFLCLNGMISGETFGSVAFRHHTGQAGDDWRESVRRGLRLVDRAPVRLSGFAQQLRIMRGARMTDKRLREILGLFPGFGDNLLGKIVRRYVDHEEATVFGLMQGGTNVLWHGESRSASSWDRNDEYVSALIEYARMRL